MQIKLWNNFNKRRNSTKQPAAASAIEKRVILKENTSIENPTFLMTSTDMPEWNYAQAFGHYYFITDIVSMGKSQWEIRCEQDVLATHKSAIGEYNGFVIFSSSNYDLDINDTRMSYSNEVITTKSEYDLTFTNNIVFTSGRDGTYVFGVVNGKSNGSCGSVTYYAMSEAQLTTLSSNILLNPSFFELLTQTFNDPMNSIVSCRYLPITSIPGDSEQIYIGADTTGGTGVNAVKINGRFISSINSAVEKHINVPDLFEFANYLKGKEATTASIYLPFVGLVPFDLHLLYNNDGFLLSCFIDVITGDIVYKISKNLGGGQSAVVSTYSGNCSTNVPISSKGYDAAGIVSGAISTIGGVVTAIAGATTGGFGAVAVAGVGAAVAGTAKSSSSIENHTMVKGSESSALGVQLGKKIVLILYTQTPTDDIEAMRVEKGLPLYKTVNIGSLSGFVQCAGASISLGSLSSDRDTVNSFLNAGFYYE